VIVNGMERQLPMDVFEQIDSEWGNSSIGDHSLASYILISLTRWLHIGRLHMSVPKAILFNCSKSHSRHTQDLSMERLLPRPVNTTESSQSEALRHLPPIRVQHLKL
jgi:hypothetical protein